MSVRKSLRCFSILLAAVCTLPLCTGCSIPFLEQEESDGSGYLFTASLAANPKSLDPQSATDAASKTIIENLYEGLVELDENGSPQLAAAENYTVSPDGLTYTFTLKSDRFWFYDANADDVVDDDEKWQVTADDYVYAFQRIFDPQTQSPYTSMFSCLQNADAVQSGQLTPEEIGVRAVSSTVLQFSLFFFRFHFCIAYSLSYQCRIHLYRLRKCFFGATQNFSAISLPLPPCHAAKPFSSRPKADTDWTRILLPPAGHSISACGSTTPMATKTRSSCVAILSTPKHVGCTPPI
mgnify:CR=1 FL=1